MMRLRITGMLLYLTITFLSFSVDAQEVRPNILIILSDDQGYHDVSLYGTPDILTPNIDALFRDGIRFDNFYASSTVCSPTRAALLTGCYPDVAGVPGVIRTDSLNSWGYLHPQSILLPRTLKSAGYTTAMVGKWHLGLESANLPNERGFDYFRGWLGDMMDDYWSHRRHGINYMRHNRTVIDPEGHATDLFSEWAAEFILKQKGRRMPFFLYLAYNAPHFPVQPPQSLIEEVRKRRPGITEKRASLVALIEHMDEGIGKVVASLKQSGLYDNTIIIFTSDNGGHLPSEANNGPYRDGKGSMYEGGLRVPACVVWKNVISPGLVSHQVNTSVDVVPTVLEMIGMRPETLLDGRSFALTLRTGKGGDEERPLYFVRREGGLEYGGKCIYAMRLGDWKLVQNSPYLSMELFNLKRDPFEQEDLAEAFPEIYSRMNDLLMRHIQNGARVGWQEQKRE